MKKNEKKEKEHTTSISTPIGHIKIDSEVADKPITQQVKDLFEKDE